MEPTPASPDRPPQSDDENQGEDALTADQQDLLDDERNREDARPDLSAPITPPD